MIVLIGEKRLVKSLEPTHLITDVVIMYFLFIRTKYFLQIYGKVQRIISLFHVNFEIFRGCDRRCSIKQSVPKNFTKSAGKHLCQSLFFHMVAASGLQLYQNRDSGTDVFL